MTFEPILDHAVIDARDNVDDAVALYRRLGFALTARGYHSIGSVNHLAVFQSNYIELLGWEGSANPRPELARFPLGLNGLVFRAEDADTVSAQLANAGLPVQLPNSFSRPVRLPNGAQTEARFRTVRFDTGTFGSTRTYFCEHFTPELVWRDEWQHHDNAVVDIARVLIQAAQPHRLGTLLATMFGEALVTLDGDRCVLQARNARIEIVPRAELAHAFRDATPELGSRDEALAGLTLRSADIAQTAAALARGGVPTLQIGNGRIVVPAGAALNVMLEFTE
ncbi:MAG: VOC family protein [Candidatus Eremiobacteraeota bacterium]|nr:VOC family protein [Candidatus Eremiobacteraeota bacterium]